MQMPLLTLVTYPEFSKTDNLTALVHEECGLMCFSCFALAACEKELADVVFLLDRSGSITDQNYKAMLNFTADIVNSLDVSKDFIHIGVAQFSDDPHDEFYLTDFTDKKEMIAHIEKMEYTGGNTYIGKALNHIKGYFDASRGSRAFVPKNLVLVTDGNSHDDVEDAADDLRDLGIEVFAVGVGDVYDLQLLQITGTPERLFNVRNFDNLVKIKQKVVDALCKPQKIIKKGKLKNVVCHSV